MIDKDIATIVELSDLSGVSRSKIYDYLNGASPFSAAFEKICNTLEAEPSELIEREMREENINESKTGNKVERK